MEDLSTVPGASLLVSIEAIQNIRGIVAGFFKAAKEARDRADEAGQENAYNALATALSYEAQGGAMQNVLHYLLTKEVVESLPDVEPLNPWGQPRHTTDSVRRLAQDP